MFQREGSDLVTQVTATLPQALLGTELSVPTLEGSVMMRIPAGTQSGTTFRLRGKGMPELRGKGVGDELVKVNVEIPRKLMLAPEGARRRAGPHAGGIAQHGGHSSERGRVRVPPISARPGRGA